MSASPTFGWVPNRRVDLVCYDFDGVMTDNRVLVDETGREAVQVNRADGMAVTALRKLGVPQIILSTETNPVVAARARKLQIPVLQGLEEKSEVLARHLGENGFDAAHTVFIGNDLNDLSAMRLVGLPVAPADAHPAIRSLAVFVTKAKGGEGVIRDFVENYLCAAGA